MIPKKLTNLDQKKFQTYFNASITKFWHPLFGFDIIKFDGFLQTPDGISTKDFITKNQGEEAAEFIKYLIDI